MAAGGEAIGPLIAAFLGNSAIAVLKGIAAFFTGSGALLAESVHSMADALNQVLLYVGMRRAKKDADDLHPLGYGKETYFWTFLVALGIFSGGAVFSLYEGIHRVLHPPDVGGSRMWGYGVLIGSMLFEGGSLYVALAAFRKALAGQSILRSIREARDPVLATVVLEDSAAMFGLVAALAGLALTDITGMAVFDGIASIVIGIILAIVAIFLGFEAYSLLLGESAHPEVRRKIVASLRASPDVRTVWDVRTLQMGASQVTVLLEVELSDSKGEAVPDAVARVDAAVRALDPSITRVYVEPQAAPPEAPAESAP